MQPSGRTTVVPAFLTAILISAGSLPSSAQDRTTPSSPLGLDVTVKNFPSVRPVVVEASRVVLDVRDVDLTRVVRESFEIGTGEVKWVGPLALDGRRRAQIQNDR